MLFLIQRRDRALLVFSFISLGVAVRQLATSEYFWLGLTGIPLYTVLRIEVGSVFLVCLLFNLYFRLVFPARAPRIPFIVNIVSGAVLLALMVLAPPRVYTTLLMPLNLYAFLTACFGLYTIIRAITGKEPQAYSMVAGLLLLALPSALDIVVTQLHLNIPYLMPLGLVPFIMIQSYILAKRYTRGAEEAENLRVTTTRLKRLDETKTNFLANISHELRTPLTLIRAPLESITTGEYGREIPSTHPVFALIRGNVERLLHLIENILSLTRLESAEPFELVPSDLGGIIPLYVADFSVLAERKGITLSFGKEDGTVGARIHPKALETIIFNLLSNALKFTPPGGTVSVLLSRSQQEGRRMVRIEVRDTGCGIAEEELQHLFVRYHQIYDRERHEYEGSGLGLSISKEIAGILGGDLRVESVRGRGSSFFLELPEADCAPGDGVPSGADAGRGNAIRYREQEIAAPDREGGHIRKPKKILVVEDNAQIRGFLRYTLEEDYEVLAAENGEAALALLGAESLPELILCDIMMPRMDGPTFLARLRELQGCKAIPLIFLTARDEPEEKVELLRNGSLDYIVKPFSVEELRARITAVLNQREQERILLLGKLRSAILEPDSAETDAELTSREEKRPSPCSERSPCPNLSSATS